MRNHQKISLLLLIILLNADFIHFTTATSLTSLLKKSSSALTAAKKSQTYMTIEVDDVGDAEKACGAISAIFGVFSGDGATDFMKLAQGLSGFLGVAGGLFSFISIFLPQQESPELKFMRKEFHNLNNKLDLMGTRIDQLEDRMTVEFEDVKINDEKKVIETALSYYQKILDLTSATREGHIKKLVALNLETVLDHYISGLKYYKLDAVIKREDYNCSSVNNVYTILLKPVYDALLVLSLEWELTKKPEKEKVALRAEYAKDVSDFLQRIQSSMNTCYDGVITQAKKDLEKMMKEDTESTTYEFAPKLRKHLDDKFQKYYWYVAVYNDISGWDLHTVYGHGWLSSFRVNERNTVVMYVPKDAKKPVGSSVNNCAATEVSKAIQNQERKYNGDVWDAWKVNEELKTLIPQDCGNLNSRTILTVQNWHHKFAADWNRTTEANAYVNHQNHNKQNVVLTFSGK